VKLINIITLFTILLYSTVGNITNSAMTRADRVSYNSSSIFEKYLSKSPPRIQLFYYTNYYCDIYDVPERVAWRVLRLETNYRGPLDVDYNPIQISSANALGPWQLLYSTARFMYDEKQSITKQRVLKDIRLNTKLGLKYLRYLYDIYGNWTTVAGYYNTGYPVVNNYARYVSG